MAINFSPLRYHPEQARLWASAARFNVVPAGRRSGKTEIIGKRKIIRAAMRGTKFTDSRFFCAAPTRDQAKRIYWSDLKKMIPRSLLLRDPSETELKISFIHGPEIHVLGMDKPERIEGTPWDGGVLDEYGNMKKETWPEHVRPSLSDRLGWCDFIGVPEGRNHYYNLFEDAKVFNEEAIREGLPVEWDTFQWPSADILPVSEIAAARRHLDELTFAQEYEACHLFDTLVRLADGTEKRISSIKPGDIVLSFQNKEVVPATVIASKYTGRRPICRILLENGNVFKASTNHKMRISSRPVELQDCKSVDLVFQYSAPNCKEEAIAAVVAFNLGDGTIHENKSTHRLQGAFYSNDRVALVRLADAMVLAGFTVDGRRPNVCQMNKNVPIGTNPCFHIQVGHKVASKLVAYGAVIGKKKLVSFGVPEWVKQSPLLVKKSFLASIFGAEGNTPKLSGHLVKNGIWLSMKAPVFVSELKKLLLDIGVKASVKRKKDGYSTLYVNSSFIDKVGYLFCSKKELMAWLQRHYMLCMRDVHRRIFDMRLDGFSWIDIGKHFNLKSGTVRQYGMFPNTKRVPSWYPRFEEWKKARFINGKLRLKIVKKEFYSEQDVWNITVDSPDHSYILANDLDNFNSFINFTGQAYHSFDEQKHCGRLEYDPNRPILFCFDFNVAPGVAVILQEQIMPRHDEWGSGIIGEVWIPSNSNTIRICDRLIQDWGDHKSKIICYGDSTGGAKGTAKILGSDWQLIKQKLWNHFGNSRVHFKVPPSNPRERDRVNSVNSRLLSMTGDIRMMVDPVKAPHTKIDFEGVRLVEGGSGEIDKNADPELTHLTDSIGYYVYREYPVRKHYAPGPQIPWK